ncbi:TolC family protein [Prosthecochloris sp. N3]|uniref:TolC family protein n=1 Tax=Prosthecochloris ethylica TaxID=2743976 RepID=A0ABR9XR90_9CHLB|nr:TolC family protein [Prosthecochloris ethylica]MBF0586045.1 TolC family protein [Prosthecochloris ethylica]MBF0636555.1 TolC family protein [Prosthecochloris ethylica]NUK47187.1 TolC family protein [Prosthecochloris ethylica]
MNRSAVYALLLVLGMPFDTFAQDVLTWNECVAEAAQSQPALRAADASVRQARADRQIAASERRPGISAALSASNSGSTASASDALTTYSYGLSVSQLVYDGGVTSLTVSGSDEAVVARQEAYRAVSSEQRLLLRTAFVNLLKAQELVGIAREIAERRQQNVRLLKLRYDAGREHLGSLRRSEADLAEAEFEVAQAERGLVLAQSLLASALGRETRSALRVKGEFGVASLPSTAPDFEALAHNHPVMHQYEAAVRQARYERDAAARALYPEISASSSIGKSSLDDWPPANVDWTAALQLSLPIYTGGKARAQEAKALWQLNEQAEQSRSIYLGLVDTLEESWKNFVDATEQVQVSRTFLDAAAERSTIADAQYSNGLISFDDWVIIENNLVSSKKSYLDARAQLLLAEADWMEAQGVPLDE